MKNMYGKNVFLDKWDKWDAINDGPCQDEWGCVDECRGVDECRLCQKVTPTLGHIGYRNIRA